MKKQMVSGYKIIIEPQFVDVSNLEDVAQDGLPEILRVLKLDGIVRDEEHAILAVKNYFKKLEGEL